MEEAPAAEEEEIDIAASLRKAGITDPDDEGDDAEEEPEADINVADQTWETTEATESDPAGGSYSHQETGAKTDVEVRPEVDKMASEKITEVSTTNQSEESNEAAAS